MPHDFIAHVAATLAGIDADRLTKRECPITSAQGTEITVGDRTLTNLCANNYLGLADRPDLIRAARAAMDEKGFGLPSVRFICGTQDLHRAVERRLAAFAKVGRHPEVIR
jgi:glycine C-acetyltransferase